MKHLLSHIIPLLRFMARPEIFFYALLWLIFLLFVGTVSQKSIGLYEAQQVYFSSFILWAEGFIPLPSGYMVMAVIFFNLLAKLLSECWSWQKTGTIIVHIGALLLLFGGFLTAGFSQEGSMVIAEGESSNYIADYHQRELVLINTTATPAKEVALFDANRLHGGEVLQADTLPFTLHIEAYYPNTMLTRRDDANEEKPWRGMARAIALGSAPLLKNNEQNLAGTTFRLSGADEKTNGLYSLFESMPITQTVTVEGITYAIALRRKRTYLPFSLRLMDFDKQVHPGTDKARSYHSEVLLSDGDLEWHSLIRMNEPLRYKGYTFYQSSFIRDGSDETTVLAVVKNIGRLFPYIASTIICIGLLVHVFQRLPKLIRRRA